MSCSSSDTVLEFRREEIEDVNSLASLSFGFKDQGRCQDAVNRSTFVMPPRNGVLRSLFGSRHVISCERVGRLARALGPFALRSV